MPNVTFSDALLLLNAGEWCLRGGHDGKSIARDAMVTYATIEADVLRIECGSAVIEKSVDRLYAMVIGRDDPREIHITGPAMVRQQRKKIDGGGWHEVERKTLLFRFVHLGAEARREAVRREKSEARRLEELGRKRRDEKLRAEAAAAAELRRRTVELSDEAGGRAKCFILHCDWKERHESKEIAEALRLVFDGENCPAIIDVPDTQSDMLACVVSSVAISAKQAQAAWDLYLERPWF